VFRTSSGHGYGSVYSGPIGSVLTPALVGIERARDLPEASTLCGRCEEVCPVKIPLPRMLRAWRVKEFERHLTPAPYRWTLAAWRAIAARPWVYRLVSDLARANLVRLARRQGGVLHKLPGLAGEWTKDRDMAVGRGATFQSRWRAGRRR
jgi:L-lactate dehydrogenase complex protein LldF